MPTYTNKGLVQCDEGFDTSNIKGKSAVITGGANGIGEQHVRALVKHGAYVTFGDIDEAGGKKLESELKGSAKFVKCDVLEWKDQLALFRDAIANSPSKRVDIAVANAGVAMSDDVFDPEDDSKDEPDEPKLKVAAVNITAVFYTTKLALFYFRRQFAQDKAASGDQLLVYGASIAGYLDLPATLQYSASKYALRSMMRSLRRTEHAHGIRVNTICPWFVKTGLIEQAIPLLDSQNAEYATTQDCALALTKFASDPSINGRAFGIFPRTQCKAGYVDLGSDTYKEGDFLKSWQRETMRLLANEED